MTRTSFFKSRPVVYGSVIGTLGCAAGSCASTFIALKLATQLSVAIQSRLSQFNGKVDIPELTADLHHNNYSKTITLSNISMTLSAGLTDEINQANKLYDYCFYGLLIFGLGVTMSVSLGLAAVVIASVRSNDEQKKDEEADEGYSLMV